jgi:hypothetical protein
MNCLCRFNLSWGILLAVLITCLYGCGDNLPKRVPVSGQVFLDGKPLEYGAITVMTQGQRMAGGRIGPDGKFTIGTFTENDGCFMGKHPVAVNAAKGISSTKMRWYAPKKYADVATSGLEIDVTGPLSDVKINLTSDPGQKYPFIEQL